jgi:hypothetical protein
MIQFLLVTCAHWKIAWVLVTTCFIVDISHHQGFDSHFINQSLLINSAWKIVNDHTSFLAQVLINTYLIIISGLLRITAQSQLFGFLLCRSKRSPVPCGVHCSSKLMLLELCNEVWKLKRHLAAEKRDAELQ